MWARVFNNNDKKKKKKEKEKSSEKEPRNAITQSENVGRKRNEQKNSACILPLRLQPMRMWRSMREKKIHHSHKMIHS